MTQYYTMIFSRFVSGIKIDKKISPSPPSLRHRPEIDNIYVNMERGRNLKKKLEKSKLLSFISFRSRLNRNRKPWVPASIDCTRKCSSDCK